MNKLLLSPKRNIEDQGDVLASQPDQDCLLEGHAQWEQASTAAAMILSGLSPLSTPVKSTLGGMRSPQQYALEQLCSPFSTFAKQLSPLVAMGGSTLAMSGQKAVRLVGLKSIMNSWAAAAGAYHMYQESYGGAPLLCGDRKRGTLHGRWPLVASTRLFAWNAWRAPRKAWGAHRSAPQFSL